MRKKIRVPLASATLTWGPRYDGVVGKAFEEELPEAVGGEGDRTYAVANLPAGLVFDEDTRTISGTPTAIGEATVTYTVLDSEG